MPTINLVVFGPPATVNSNLASIVSAINSSGATLNGEVNAGGEGAVTSDASTLTGLTVAFRGRIVFPLVGTRAQFDSLKTSLQTIKAGASSLNFGAALDGIGQYLELAAVVTRDRTRHDHRDSQ